MKKILLFLLLVPPYLFSSICLADTLNKNHKKATLHFQSSQEPTAKDALWTTNRIFKVGVYNNGSNFNGYAEYTCLTLVYDFGFGGKRIWVHIFDYYQLLQKDKWIKIGEARCN